jgi:DNA-binding XRE family transcriptional regulator
LVKLKLIKDRFNTLRISKGMTVADVAIKAGLTKQALYNIVHEKNCAKPGTAKSIADSLNVPLDEIFDLTEQ